MEGSREKMKERERERERDTERRQKDTEASRADVAGHGGSDNASLMERETERNPIL